MAILLSPKIIVQIMVRPSGLCYTVMEALIQAFSYMNSKVQNFTLNESMDLGAFSQ